MGKVIVDTYVDTLGSTGMCPDTRHMRTRSEVTR
jgi:hypothetical protein